MSDTSARPGLRLVLTAVFLVLLLLFLYSVAELLLLLFIAILLSTYLGALTDWFERRLRLPRVAGIAASVLVTLVGVGGVGALLVPPLAEQTSALFVALPQQLIRWEASLVSLLETYPLLRDLAPPIAEGQSYFGTLFREIGQYFTDVFPYLFTGLWFLIHAVSVLAMGVYLTAKPGEYRAELIQLVPRRHRDLAIDVLHELGTTLRAWVGGQILAMIVLGVLTWIGLAALGVPFSLAFGVFTGLVAIVPFFGTLFSTLLPALYVLPSDGVLYALAVAMVGVGVHLFEANVVAPKIFERQVELPPVWTLLSVLVAFKLLGPVGLIVAVPVVAVLRVLIRRLYVERMVEGGGYHPTASDEPVMIRVPTGEDLVLAAAESELSVPELLERRAG